MSPSNTRPWARTPWPTSPRRSDTIFFTTRTTFAGSCSITILELDPSGTRALVLAPSSSLHSPLVTEPSTRAMPGASTSGHGDRGRTVTISEALEVSDELVAAFEHLVPQLSSSSPAPTAAQLAEIVASPATVLFVASDESGALVGSLTLALFRVPTGVLSWIEDVVVDESARGAGAGEKLVAAALG